MRWVEGRTLDQKNRQFLQTNWDLVLFFRNYYKAGRRFPRATRDQGFGVKDRQSL
jgi:hypothetical protein